MKFSNPFKPQQKPIKVLSVYIREYLLRVRRVKAYKQCYHNIIRHLDEFTAHTGLTVNTNSFTEQFSEEFLDYLREKQLMKSTVRSIFRKVVTVLNRAARDGYLVDTSYKYITVEDEYSNAIYLTLDELKRLNELKGLSKEAKAVRDRFLVGCFTALRISDYRRLSVEDNFINGLIQIKTQKTGVNVIIPIHPIIRDVLSRNNNVLPKMPSQQAFGATLKRVCKKAGITDSVLWERTVGNKVVHKKMKKYQLVSSHTARRSGATNMYLAGIPTARIMLLTGHQTESAFFKYVRIHKEENAKALAEHDFFKTKV
jgi:site-specific recombinase XerD